MRLNLDKSELYGFFILPYLNTIKICSKISLFGLVLILSFIKFGIQKSIKARFLAPGLLLQAQKLQLYFQGHIYSSL